MSNLQLAVFAVSFELLLDNTLFRHGYEALINHLKWYSLTGTKKG